jgi:hypothetical protein
MLFFARRPDAATRTRSRSGEPTALPVGPTIVPEDELVERRDPDRRARERAEEVQG